MRPEVAVVLFLAASLTGVVAVWLVGTRLLPFLFRRLTTVDLRRVALGCALVGIAALGIYPPWSYTHHLNLAGASSAVTRPAPRAFVFSPPEPESPVFTRYRYKNLGDKDEPSASSLDGVVLDTSRLAVEWLVVAALGAAGRLLLSRRKGTTLDQAQEDASRKQLIDSHLRNVVHRWRQMAKQGGEKEVWAEVADLVEEDLRLAQDPNGTDHGRRGGDVVD